MKNLVKKVKSDFVSTRTRRNVSKRFISINKIIKLVKT